MKDRLLAYVCPPDVSTTSNVNGSYDIALDDGTLRAKFGDPRRLGGKLPLWVVIGADGKIAHYKVGLYDINPDEGLRALDQTLVEQIKKQRAGR